MRKRNRKEGTCSYCGQIRVLTKEHVVPQCLLNISDGDSPIIVPACEQCAGEKSIYDERLRDALTIDAYSSHNEFALAAKRNKVARSIRRNRSAVVREIQADRHIVTLCSADGTAYLLAGCLTQSEPALAIEYILRGLYYFKTRRVLDPTISIKVERVFPHEAASLCSKYSEIGFYGPFEVGDTVRYFYAITEDLKASVWIVEFFSNIVFEGRVGLD